MTKKFCIILLNIYIYKDFDIILWIFAQLCERKFGGNPLGGPKLLHFSFLEPIQQENGAPKRSIYL